MAHTAVVSLTQKGTALDCRELEAYLHEHIPLSKVMGVQVLTADCDRVQLAAPLQPNINHRDTVFGGSVSAVAILAGWSLVYVRLREEGIEGSVVIQRNTMKYERPIPEKFTALSSLQDSTTWQRFVKILKRKHRARIGVAVMLQCDGERVGELEGDFVALGAQSA
jgi:thioesterase domain-containing protein